MLEGSVTFLLLELTDEFDEFVDAVVGYVVLIFHTISIMESGLNFKLKAPVRRNRHPY